MVGPCDGLVVLDFSWGMAGGLATAVLADFGADVIKMEPPEGDPFRQRPIAAYRPPRRYGDPAEFAADAQLRIAVLAHDTAVEHLPRIAHALLMASRARVRRRRNRVDAELLHEPAFLGLRVVAAPGHLLDLDAGGVSELQGPEDAVQDVAAGL